MKIDLRFTGYKITAIVDEKITFQHRLRKKWFRMQWVVVNDLKEEFCRFKIKSGFWMCKFTLIAQIKVDGRSIAMHYKSRPPHILFDDSGSNYKIVFHHSHRTSLYRDNVQFASMRKVRAVEVSGMRFLVLANDDIDCTFILMLLYAILLARYNDSDEATDITVDFGFTGRELQPIDSSWHPKTSTN